MRRNPMQTPAATKRVSTAVAAALQYQSEVKNPAYAPAVHQPDKWTAEMAA